MSPQAQRIAIAEACGFEFRDEGRRYPDDPNWQKYKAVYRGDGFIGLAKPEWVPVPDYLNNLNAMHEVEKVLTPEQQAQYAMTLHDMHGIPLATFWHRVICSTAAQRAEAFLRTIGKWEDDK